MSANRGARAADALFRPLGMPKGLKAVVIVAVVAAVGIAMAVDAWKENQRRAAGQT